MTEAEAVKKYHAGEISLLEWIETTAANIDKLIKTGKVDDALVELELEKEKENNGGKK